MKVAFSTARNRTYLRYCLDRWEEGEAIYLLRLLNLRPYRRRHYPHPSDRLSSSTIESTPPDSSRAASGTMNNRTSKTYTKTRREGESQWL